MADATGPMIPAVARVRARRSDGPEIVTLDIEGPKGAPAFAPGQFNMLSVFGVGEVPISVSGDPAAPDRLVHTVRAVGAVSKALTALKPGDAVGLRGPFGAGWPMDEAVGRDVLIIAGGLGLAPLRSALYPLLAARERYGRLSLLYGTRNPDAILFRRELDQWRKRGDIDVAVTVDRAPPSWHGHVGVVTTLIGQATFDPARSVAFVCGPEVMMRFTVAALGRAGLAADAIHLSMERNMKCAIGLCGHCQFSPVFVCRDGPVFRYDKVRDLLGVKEL